MRSIDFRFFFRDADIAAAARARFPKSKQQHPNGNKKFFGLIFDLLSDDVEHSIREALLMFPDARRDVFVGLMPDEVAESVDVPFSILKLAIETNSPVLFNITYVGPCEAHP